MCQRAATFRLLDSRVGWDIHQAQRVLLDGPRDEACLVLAPKHSGEVSEEEVLPWFMPPWLAHGTVGCDWLLAPGAHASRLLRAEPCANAFQPWGPQLHRVDAVASDCHRWSVVADGAAQAVVVLDAVGRPFTRLAIAEPQVVAITPWEEVLVASRNQVWRFGVGGEARGRLKARFHRIVAMRVDRQGKIWVVSRDRAERLRLARFKRTGARLRKAAPAMLPQVLSPTGVYRWNDTGLCWASGNGPVAPCIDRNGKALEGKTIPLFGKRARQQQGTLVTLPIDSGEQRTVWHRIRLDADVPLGTEVRIAIATVDEPDELTPEDGWFEAPPGSLDFLSTAPPGRYLRLRLQLEGDEGLTPCLRQVRLDFPRATSANLLPAVYREEPRAADFTERFVSIFDAEVEQLDRAIAQFPALLSADRAPPELLSWLGGFMGLGFDASWDTERRRAFLREAPALFRARGTPQGLVRALEIACGAPPALLELGNPFGAVSHSAVLGAMRLHGRNQRRFRMGRSALGQSTLRSFGNPDADPLRETAYQFNVLFPPGVAQTPTERQRLKALVQALKPAHTVARIHFGGSGFIVGTSSAVGIDTALLPPPAAVLGSTSRLTTMVLAPSPKARTAGLRLEWPVVGITTSL